MAVATRRRHDAAGIVLGILGELLLTVGALLGLFVIWQVWWTDVEAKSHTESVITEMALPPAPSQSLPDDARQVDTPAPAPPAMALPEDAFAVIRIPAFGPDYQVPVAEGVSLSGVLHRGLAGHYPGTAQVGQIGNFAVAGHRQSHGAIFRNVDQLTAGDAVVVETSDTWYVYTVTETRIVDPTAVEVIAAVPGDPEATPSIAAMTITTCHPLWSVAERLVVHSELSYWAPKTAGVPTELEVA